MTKSQFLRIGVFLAVALVALFVVLRLLSLRGDLASAPSIERPGLLVPAMLLYAAALLAYGLLWRDIVCRLDRVRTPAVDALSVFFASWLGRYVPSSLPYLAGKIAMGVRLGHSKPALAASLLYENGLVVAVGVVSSSVVIPVVLVGQSGGALTYAGAGLGGIMTFVLLSPPVLDRGVNLAARLTRRQPVPRGSLLSFRGILTGAAMAAAGLALNGACFALVVGSFVELSARELVASAAIFNLAGTIGVAVLPVPSGLGVREAVLIGLLQLYMPLEVAAAAAILVRLAGILVDVLLGIAGASVFALRQTQLPASRDRLRREQHVNVP